LRATDTGPFKKNDEAHRIKIDRYDLETNVHFLTDLNLAWDAARKTINLTSRLTADLRLPGWRKKSHWKKGIKKAMRDCSQAGKGGGANKQGRLIRAATDYLGVLACNLHRIGAHRQEKERVRHRSQTTAA
jgi:hypothetical protein